MRRFVLAGALLVGCGGAPNEPVVSMPKPQPPATTAECAPSTPVIAKRGESIKQAIGSVQRFQLVYQGDAIAVTQLRGVDMVIGPSDGPFTVEKNAGWWAEVRDASGKTTFTRILRDPTHVEVPPPPGGGAFSNVAVDRCKEQIVLVDVPRAPAGSVLIVFGDARGTQGPTRELARFTME